MQQDNKVPRIVFHKILYVTDLSESGRYAFPYAASIANCHGASLTVFHAVEDFAFEKYLVGYIGDDLWDELKQRNLEEAKQLITERKRDDAAIRNTVSEYCEGALAEHEARPYVTYDVVVKMGEPVQLIVNEAHEGGYDLVVVGKHGHGGAQQSAMGHITERVMRRCTVPVLVVPLPEGSAVSHSSHPVSSAW